MDPASLLSTIRYPLRLPQAAAALSVGLRSACELCTSCLLPMSTEEMAEKAGEAGLTEDVNSIYQLIALVLAKYGMIGVVVAYFGWINWQQHSQLIDLTKSTIITASEQTEAVRALTKAVERMDTYKRP